MYNYKQNNVITEHCKAGQTELYIYDQVPFATSRGFQAELGKYPSNVLYEKKMAASMTLKPQKVINLLYTLFALIAFIKDSSFYFEIIMPGDFIKRSTTRLTCRHIKN